MAGIGAVGGRIHGVYPEDSCFLKAISSIPLLGRIPRMILENLLETKYIESNSIQDKIHIIKIKNDYKTASNISSVLLVACLVALISAGILAGSSALFFGGLVVALSCFSVAFTNNNITHNNRAIKELRDTGQTSLDIA